LGRRPEGNTIPFHFLSASKKASSYQIKIKKIEQTNLLYREFKGDHVLPIVLGEIAHHNIIRLYSLKSDSIEVHEQAATYPERMKHLEPTNGFSISQASGIPRETVRRKIDKLEKKGWVVKNDRGEVCISEKVSDQFTKGFNAKILAELLEASECIRNILKPI